MKLNSKIILPATAIACAVAAFSSSIKANDLDSEFAMSKIQPIETCVGEAMVSPFIQVDEQATINKIKGDDRAKAQDYLSQIQQIDNSIDQDLSVEQESRLITLESRLTEIIEKQNVKCVKRDMLANLSRDDKLRALEIWHDIEVKLELDNNQDFEADSAVESLMTELDAIMAKVN